KNAASKLPALPDTFFGWIPVLYKITEEQVLASAGLDAYVVSCVLQSKKRTGHPVDMHSVLVVL
ncbi:MAG: hypothetical protein Q9183_006378, partial [Haloplaca sp. 2 TL-2023]